MFFNLFFNWRIIVLQCSVGFCPTTMQIRHNYICMYIHIYVCVCVLPCKAPSPLPPHPIRLSQSARLGSLLHTSFPLALCFTHDSIYMSELLSQYGLPSPSLIIHNFVISFCISIPSLQIGSSVLFV